MCWFIVHTGINTSVWHTQAVIWHAWPVPVWNRGPARWTNWYWYDIPVATMLQHHYTTGYMILVASSSCRTLFPLRGKALNKTTGLYEIRSTGFVLALSYSTVWSITLLHLTIVRQWVSMYLWARKPVFESKVIGRASLDSFSSQWDLWWHGWWWHQNWVTTPSKTQGWSMVDWKNLCWGICCLSDLVDSCIYVTCDIK